MYQPSHALPSAGFDHVAGPIDVDLQTVVEVAGEKGNMAGQMINDVSVLKGFRERIRISYVPLDAFDGKTFQTERAGVYDSTDLITFGNKTSDHVHAHMA